MRCELCSSKGKPVSTQCPCRGGGCKGCGQSNNQVTYTNELLKLGMEPKMIHENLDFIHKAQNSRIQAYDVWDSLVNGKEFSDEQKEALEKGIALKNSTPVIIEKPQWKSLGENPSAEHHFPSKSPWAICDYCGGLQHYVKKKPCPAFKGNNNEE